VVFANKKEDVNRITHTFNHVRIKICNGHVTFCDVASVEKAKQDLNQKLIEEQDAKDRQIRELKKRLSEYEGKLGSVVNRIGDILGQADPLKQKEYLEAVKNIHQNQ
jgi:hypothetical protein